MKGKRAGDHVQNQAQTKRNILPFRIDIITSFFLSLLFLFIIHKRNLQPNTINVSPSNSAEEEGNNKLMMIKRPNLTVNHDDQFLPAGELIIYVVRSYCTSRYILFIY